MQFWRANTTLKLDPYQKKKKKNCNLEQLQAVQQIIYTFIVAHTTTSTCIEQKTNGSL